MTLISLPVLLYLVPITVLAAALVPQNRRAIPLALGGMVYCFLAGGWECVTAMLLMICAAWFTVRLQPRIAERNRRAVMRWIYVGSAVQIILLLLARMLAAPAARLPLLLCALQGIICIRERGLGDMRIPALLSYFGYSSALPRLFAGPVLSYDESRRLMRAAEKPSLKTIGEGAEICVRGLFQLVLLSLPMETLWERLRTEITLVSTPDALLTLPVIYFTLYYRLKGAVTFGEGIAHMLGMQYPESFDTPVFAFSLKGYCSRTMMPLTAWMRRLFLANGKNTDHFTYCARLLPLLGGMGLVLCDGVSGLVFGTAAALLLTAERMMLERWLTNIPKPLRRTFTGLLILLCMGFLYSGGQAETFSFYMILLGKNSIAMSRSVIYMIANEWLALLLCVIGLFPLRKAFQKWEQRHSILSRFKVIAVPLLALCVTVFCMVELFSRYLR